MLTAVGATLCLDFHFRLTMKRALAKSDVMLAAFELPSKGSFACCHSFISLSGLHNDKQAKKLHLPVMLGTHVAVYLDPSDRRKYA